MHFSQLQMVQIKKCQCPSVRALPEVLKTHLTLNSSVIFVGAMASQTWESFFWDTLYINSNHFHLHV